MRSSASATGSQFSAEKFHIYWLFSYKLTVNIVKVVSATGIISDVPFSRARRLHVAYVVRQDCTKHEWARTLPRCPKPCTTVQFTLIH